MDWFQKIANIFQQPASPQHDSPMRPKVLMITHNPHLRSGSTLIQHFRWRDPQQLAQTYISDVAWCSYGYVQYQIVEHLQIDGFPVKLDGFRYDERSFFEAWTSKRLHEPNAVDYLSLVREFKMIERVNSGEIDEVWLFGDPYAGYYESIMAGRGA